jgi:hypothetical protein
MLGMRYLVAIVACAAWLALPVAAAPAKSHRSGFCQMSGNVSVSPGLTTAAQNVAIDGGGHETLCMMTDRTMHSSTLRITGLGRASCLGGSISGRFTNAWNNGTQSSGTFTVHTLGLIQTVSGRVTDGPFTGGVSGEFHLLTKANVFACSSDPGLTDIAFAGFIRFNGP